jgi:DNA-binding response OmpR family regulator
MSEPESQPQSRRGTPLILVVEDEERVASFVRQSLGEAGFEVSVARDVATGGTRWELEAPDLVILDLMLPDGDGVDLLTSARQRGARTPVLVLSAKSSMSDRVSGLDAGADDYLPKPFGIEELLARVRVLLRRAKESHASVLQIDDLRIDFSSRRVLRANRLIFLSETEYRLLELLALNLGEPVSKRDILAQVWDDAERDDNVVEVYVSYLRTKLEWGRAKRLVHTIRGRGYVLSESDDVS